MSDIKMSDVFSLPVEVSYMTGMLFYSNDFAPVCFAHVKQTNAAAHAINNHDRLTAELAEAKAENERLREALKHIINVSQESFCTPEDLEVGMKALSGEGE